jgi:hypothetical protein
MNDKKQEEYRVYKKETKRNAKAILIGALAMSLLILAVMHCCKPIRNCIYNKESIGDNKKDDKEMLTLK